MSTKRFAWKDRDTAALDLIQLVYHAPQFISQQALYILSAIRSDVIIADLKAITLDSERKIWERIYALRALAKVSGEIYFPELAPIADGDLWQRQQIFSQAGNDPDRINESYIPTDMIGEFIAFSTRHPSNRHWLWDCLDQADPLVACALLFHELPIYESQEMSDLCLYRLIALLEAYPSLLNLFSIYQIYTYASGNAKAQAFLNKHFDAIVEKSISAGPSRDKHRELPWTILFEWLELRAAIFQQRPDYEEKFRRDEAKEAASRSKHEAKYREDFSYTQTAIWLQLEALYERTRFGDNAAFWELYDQTYKDKLSVPVRAAATHFFGKLRDRDGVIEKLAFLIRRHNDTWDGDLSPVRFEAGQALFDAGTPQAWEAFIAASFANPSNVFDGFLRDWIECLTDMLSGIVTVHEHTIEGLENRWFKALLSEPTAPPEQEMK